MGGRRLGPYMDAYDELLERLKNIDLISQIGGLLG